MEFRVRYLVLSLNYMVINLSFQKQLVQKFLRYTRSPHTMTIFKLCHYALSKNDMYFELLKHYSLINESFILRFHQDWNTIERKWLLMIIILVLWTGQWSISWYFFKFKVRVNGFFSIKRMKCIGHT